MHQSDIEQHAEFAAFARFRDRPALARICLSVGASIALLAVLFVFEAVFFVDWANDTTWTKFGQRPFLRPFSYIAVAGLSVGLLAGALAPLSARRGDVYGLLVAAPFAALFALPSSADSRDLVWWIQHTVPPACILVFGVFSGRQLARAA